MNRTNLTTRLFAAAAAATVTLTLFGGVVSIAEPQQSVLMAKIHQHDATQPDVRLARSTPAAATAPAVLSVAMNDGAKLVK